MAASNRPGIREHAAAKSAPQDWETSSWKREENPELTAVQLAGAQLKSRPDREAGAANPGVPDWQSMRDPASLAAVRRLGRLIWILGIGSVAASGIIWWLLLT